MDVWSRIRRRESAGRCSTALRTSDGGLACPAFSRAAADVILPLGTTLTRHRTLRQSSRPFPPPCRWPRRRHCKAQLRLDIQKLRLDIWRAQSACEASLLLLNEIEGLDAVCCHLALRLLAWDLSPLLCPPRSVEMKFVQPFSGNLDRRRRRDDPSIGAVAAIIDGWSWRRTGAAQLLVLSSGQVSR